MAWVIMPTGLVSMTEGQERVEVAATNLLAAIDQLDRRFPGLARRLVAGHSVVVDGTLYATVSTIALDADSEISFVPSIAGG